MKTGSARRAIVLFPLAFLVGTRASEAQTTTKPVRIGVLVSGQPVKTHVEALRQGLADLGYIDGRTMEVEWRWADGKSGLETLALELVRRRVDAIVTAGTPAARAARQATATIPIVMAVSGDPVGAGLVASLARPGGNITGLSSLAHGVVSKQLELFRELLPRTFRLAILFNPGNAAHVSQVSEAETAARTLKIETQAVAARDIADFDKAFSEMARHRADGVVVLADLFFVANAARLADLAAKHRIAAIYAVSEHVEAGGLIAYGSSRRDMYRRAATLVDQVLRGAKPADLPIEQATTFELVVNLKTAKALGLPLPQSVLLRSDHLIGD